MCDSVCHGCDGGKGKMSSGDDVGDSDGLMVGIGGDDGADGSG